MCKTKIISLIILIITGQYLISETALIDSLETELKKTKGEKRYEILHKLGWQYHNISFEKALEYEEKAMSMAKEWGDSLRIARSLFHLARINMKRDYDQAVKLAERSIEMIEELDERRIPKYYRNLATIYENYNQFDNSTSYYSLAYEKALAFSDKKEIAIILDKIYEGYIKLNKFEQALEINKLKFNFWNEIDNEFKIAENYNDLGRSHYHLGNLNKSLVNYLESLLRLEDLKKKTDRNYDKYLISIHFNISLIYHASGNYALFIRHSKFCLEYARKLKEFKYVAKSYLLICLMYYFNSQYKESYYYANKSIHYAIENLEFNGLGTSLFYITYMLFLDNKQSNTNIHLELINKLYSKTQEKLKLCSYYENMGMYYELIEDYENAATYFNLACQNFSNLNVNNKVSENYRNLAKIFLKNNSYSRAFDVTVYSFIIADKLGLREIKRDCFLIYSQYYEYKKKFIESLNNLKLYDTIQDSIFSTDKLNAITQMDIEIKNLESQKELDLLEQQNDIISAELEQEKYTRIKLIILAASLILLTISFILYSRSLKRSNTRLEKEIKMRKSSEAELQQLSSGLEQQVAERTVQLQFVNEDLQSKINEKINSENKLLEMKKMADIGQMAAGLAHEIRNPIAIIKSTSQYLADNHKTTCESMHKLTKNSDMINDVISRLMNFARLKDFELQTINLKEVLLDVLAKFHHQIQKKNIVFDIDLPDKLPDLELDPELFSIMISNIITNSLEALPEGGKIGFKVNENANLLEITITDNGGGIDNINLALRTFYTSKKGQAGLGFNFVKYIAGIHDYIFTLKSEIDRGTEAKIILTRR